jgi:hypothetical protein
VNGVPPPPGSVADAVKVMAAFSFTGPLFDTVALGLRFVQVNPTVAQFEAVPSASKV